VATTAGVGTKELRARFPEPNVVIEDFINYDDAVHRVLNDPTYAENVAALRSELLSYDPMARIEAVVTGDDGGCGSLTFARGPSSTGTGKSCGAQSAATNSP
jgi:hypothetical protein